MSTNGRNRVTQFSQPKLESEKVQDVDWHFGDQVVRVNAAYIVPAIHPWREGPWLREADKILWRDAASGLACIIRRCHEAIVIDGSSDACRPLHEDDDPEMMRSRPMGGSRRGIVSDAAIKSRTRSASPVRGYAARDLAAGREIDANVSGMRPR